MTEIEFNALAAEGFNRIPLIAETYADLDTPLSIYLKLAHNGPEGGRYSCLMESVVGGEQFGRYSFIGLPARTVIRSYGRHTQVLHDGKIVETAEGDPLEFIEQFQARFKVALRPGMPRFAGGLAGYFGYDTVRHIEPSLGMNRKPFPSDQEEGVPDIMLLQVDELVIVDNLAGRTYLLVYADPAQPEAYVLAKRRLKDLREKLRSPVVIPYAYASMQTECERDFDKEDYLKAVARAKDYIAAGDLMQVQIGQVITKPFRDSPLSLYRALRSLNPSPYMFYIDLVEFQIIGASPELLVQSDVHNKVITHPIAGTIMRGKTAEEDEANAETLRASLKDRAEHIMLVDLARNDINRVCQPTTTNVDRLLTIERFSHVMHLVSQVLGVLRDDKTRFDAFRSIFPAGTVLGAPKVRAMELIGELEGEKRGVYAGAVGHWSYDGKTMDTCIALRTMVFKDGIAYLQAGGGIVFDSDEYDEYIETMNKMRANNNTIVEAEKIWADKVGTQ